MKALPALLVTLGFSALGLVACRDSATTAEAPAVSAPELAMIGANLLEGPGQTIAALPDARW